MKKLSDFGVRQKLYGLVIVAVALMLAIMGAAAFYYQHIESTNLFKETIYSVVQRSFDARVAEKAYLQFHQSEFESRLNDDCQCVEQEVKAITRDQSGASSKTTIKVILDFVVLYRQTFSEMTEVYRQNTQARKEKNDAFDKAEKALNVMVGPLEAKKAELQMDGANLSTDEADLLSSIRDAKIFITNLQMLYCQYVIFGDDNRWEQFSKYLVSDARLNVDLLLKVSARAGSVRNLNMAETAGVFKSQLDLFIQSAKLSYTLFKNEKEKVRLLDDIGNKLKKQADTHLAEASREAVQAKRAAMNVIGMILVGGIAIFVVIAILLVRSITQPIKTIAFMLQDIAGGKGDLTRRLDVHSRDELGEMARWFNIFVEKLQNIIRTIAQNTATLAASSEEISATSTQLASSSEQMSIQTRNVAAAGQQLSANIGSMASVSEQMSISADTVASAVSEMSASIGEVAKNCEKESRIAQQANTESRQAQEIMSKLGESAREIGKVVEVINGIADQTNLLALNATIEAASAGDAGKGFAVVANEVKELAKQSAQATGQIAKQIEAMQNNTNTAVKAISKVSSVIEEVNSISGTIASAVEEQSATTEEIAKNVTGFSHSTHSLAKNVHESAKGAGEVSKNIQSISAAIQQASTNATQTNQNTLELAKMADNLNNIVGQFKI